MSDETPISETESTWQSTWQNQTTEATMIALDDIKKKSDNFRKRIARRNWIEYIAAALAAMLFGALAVRWGGALFITGCALIVAATFFVVGYLHRRGRVDEPPAAATLADYVAFHKQQLARQRDLCRNILTWYLAPFAPGLALFLAGAMSNGLMAQGPSLSTRIVVISVVGVVIWMLNQWAARRLQRQIDALERVGAGG